MPADPSSPAVGVSNWLIQWRWGLLLFALGLTAAGVWPSMQLRFDASIVNLFSPQDPVLVAYRESVRLFGGDEVVVVAYTDPQLLTSAGLRRLHEFAEEFRTIPQVRQIASLADGRWPPAPLDTEPLYKQVQRRGLSPDDLRATLLHCELYRNLLVGKDGQTAAIAINLPPKADDPGYSRRRFWDRLLVRDGSGPKGADEKRKDTIAAIRRVAAGNLDAQGRPYQTVVAGGPILTHDASVYVDQDSRTLGWTSTAVLLVVIGALFRRLRWVVLPLAVVHVTLVWTKAILWMFSAQMSMVSTTLTALVTVIGVASIVQVTARYREERERAQVEEALRRTMAAAGPAVFWASLTTAAGFGSLLITSIVPVRTFAVMLSLASMLVFFAATALVPAVVMFGRRPSDPGAAPGESQIDRLLSATMDWSLRRPWQVGTALVVLLALTVAGIFRIRSETDFTRNFRRSSPVVTAYNFVEQRLGGVGTLQLEFAAPDGLTPELVERLRQLETRLRQNPHLTKVLGIVDVLDFFEVGSTVALSEMVGRIFGEQGRIEAKLRLMNLQRPELLPAFWNQQEKQMRVLLRAREQAPSSVKNRLIDWIKQNASELLDQPGAAADVRVTGVYTLLNHLVSGLMADQLNTFLLATVAVFSIMCLALRSVRLAVVGLVPKLGPILMVLGAMGWLGVPIDMGTPMIASVSMGLSVGFSIHYLYRFRQERLAGIPFDQALRATHRRVGGAMVFSNLALVVGFGVLTLSNFIPTVHFSILADVALVGGLAGNLLVLPLLLKLIPV